MCEATELCFDAIDHHPVGVMFEVIILVYAFFALAIVCDRYLVVSLETLCVRWNIREDVAGASFMAFGSAAPEILINAIGTIKGGGNTDLGVGAIVGSGMIAFLLIPGLCGLVATRTLQLKQRPLLRDTTMYLLALGLLCIFFADGIIQTYEAAILVFLYFVYILFVFLAPGLHQQYQAYTHRKRLWFALRRAVQQGTRGHALNQLRESLMATAPVEADDGKHFVVEAAEERQRELDRANSLQSPSAASAGATLDIELADATLGAGAGAVHDGALGSGSMHPPQYSRVDEEDAEPSPPVQPSHALTLSVPAEDSPDFDGGYDLDSATNADVERKNLNPSASPDPSDLAAGVASMRALEAPPTRAERAYAVFTWPINFLLDKTCVACEWDNPAKAKYYPLTFLVSFVWVSLFSFLISTVVGRWVALSGVSQSFFGLVLVAAGAEIPDAIQSVTVATRGYGSMAVANSCGSQITNILLGLGLPWLIADIRADATVGSKGYVRVPDHTNLQVASLFQFANLALFVVALLLVAAVKQTPKAHLTRQKALLFMGAYVACLCGYAIYIFA